LRPHLLAAGPLLLCAGAAGAQVTVALRLGAVGSTNLVKDSVVETLDVRPLVAPQLGIRASLPVGGHYTVGAGLAVSRSDLRATGDTGTTTVTALTMWSPSVFLQAEIVPWLRAEAHLGAQIYDPGETVGTLFSQGAPIDPSLGLGLVMERALGNRLVASLFVDYDVHRFTTTALNARGFTGETVVHRIAVGLSLGREFGHAKP
jgi:hypothetical protein